MGFSRGNKLETEESVERREMVFVATRACVRFSKSSHNWKDLLSHLNLYNPMNISLGGNTFIPTVHKYKCVGNQSILAITILAHCENIFNLKNFKRHLLPLQKSVFLWIKVIKARK